MTLTNNLRALYLNLLRDSILDTIYEPTNHEGKKASGNDVEVGNYWPLRAHSMIGRKRLNNIHNLFFQIIIDNVSGDLIETGVWRGGACIFMKGLVEAYNQKRKVFVADSFEGFPEPDPKYPMDTNDKDNLDYQKMLSMLKVSEEEVKNNFKKYNLLNDNVVFIKGFFEHSLSKAPIDKLSLLRLDGDMFSSTIQVLEQLYDKVSEGGYIIIDDYQLLGCQQAVTEFRKSRNIKDTVVDIDGCGAFWRKS